MPRTELKSANHVILPSWIDYVEVPAISSYDIAVAKLKSEMRKMKDKIKRVDKVSWM